MDATAFRVTLELATATTAVLFVLGLPLAQFLATSRLRLKFLIEAVVALPLVLPPTVLGFYVLVALGPQSPLGRATEALTGSMLPFTFEGVLIASVLYNLPFAVRPFTAALMAVDRRLLEASYCLGASRWRTFWRVTFPLSWAGIITGLVLTFAHTVGEFGVVLMVGGNRPGVTRTLSVAIYDDVQALDYEAAAQTSLVLVGFSLIALSVTYALGRKVPTA
jgi:molybdate transport system permease protein